LLVHLAIASEAKQVGAARGFSRWVTWLIFLTVVIVGVSPQSLGESMTAALATHSPSLLVLASRTKTKIEVVASKVKAEHPDLRIEQVELDLSSFDSIRRGAEAINGRVEQIDILINNAAVVTSTHEYTKDGLELQFGTNHVGPFLLTNLLMPKLLKAAQNSPPGSTRVINVTSQGHIISPIRYSDHKFQKRPEDIPADERPMSRPGVSFDPPPGETYVAFVAYGQSKTANILMSLYLNEHLSKAGLQSIATHPGSIWTDLSRNLDEKHLAMIENTSTFWKDIDQGSATSLVAALDPKLYDPNVIYLSDCHLAEPAEWAKDVKAAERLWRLSEELVGQKFELSTVSRL
jgi:NAD(P)-dependent dehydrogenase (short-subunit alcohol dehydrogenase family)